MTESGGRRERKKAATRAAIADTALRLFLEHGYGAVGLREVATEADVAVTTVFSHFASKEALVFAKDEDFEQRLVTAVTERAPGTPLLAALRAAIEALVRHVTSAEVAPTWRLIEATPDLQSYEESVRARHAESLAAVVATDLGSPATTPSCRALARFVVDAYAIARTSPDPRAALDEIFPMIEAAWPAARDAAESDALRVPAGGR